ncbi:MULTISPECIES: DUF2304 domain-containing protein [unclassified Actinomyces]|uniref:DUF2304 domain-containing protein n=1 Tax=unclassified Actinomyces TaxID=2609248 RepID=UPI0020183595|nr:MULTISPECIES: DUF2304 domain-containing protein [unclassified Actinomyces]MCL3776971.1 DUF2304 domain-containing protein [Actinomyces sp. AC-20-1]MCL3789026.1 DUF2304 domain-containing protein [Actinomyces sp. 187325]MCL3791459.1 DUF2304 domain-containing protein [Actinomyces sp. 186855]MCL3794010.1 DUF2304 domain-containing protein [Actinomyces sp. 217892]
MSSKIVIQVVLIVAVAVIGWLIYRVPGGSRHQAARRLVTLGFVAFAVVSIATPSLMTHLAHLVGVGRGTDLLLYALAVAFLAQMLSSFRRNAALERQVTRLARRIALMEAADDDARRGEDAPPGAVAVQPERD